jgi:hypothetical protein
MCILDFLNKNAALVVSICALGLTIFQARQAWKHNRLSVQPRLTTYSSLYTDEKDSHITYVTSTLKNCGLGPALIKSFTVVVGDDKISASEPTHLIDIAKRHTNGRILLEKCMFGVLRKESLLSKDETFEIAKVAFLDPTPDQLAQARTIHIIIGYESAYGEKFEYDSRAHF